MGAGELLGDAGLWWEHLWALGASRFGPLPRAWGLPLKVVLPRRQALGMGGQAQWSWERWLVIDVELSLAVWIGASAMALSMLPASVGGAAFLSLAQVFGGLPFSISSPRFLPGPGHGLFSLGFGGGVRRVKGSPALPLGH